MLVTIDDRITRLKEHSVSIEIVERIDRTWFYTAGSSIPLEHADENVLWIRGQHLLDSAEVKAARSAVALGEKGYELIGATGPTGPMGQFGNPFLAPGPMPPQPQPAPIPAGPAPGYGPFYIGAPHVGDVPGGSVTGQFDGWGLPPPIKLGS